MVLDSDLNQYFAYSTTIREPLHVSKINTTGDIVWSKKYQGLLIRPNSRQMYITNDQNTIRFLGEGNNKVQPIQIDPCKH